MAPVVPGGSSNSPTTNNSRLETSTNNDSDQELEEGAIRIGDIYIAPPPPPSCTFDASGPRLIIAGIFIKHFKSYGEEVNLGPFKKNFTAIVGPNGSGKSNTIDALMFVFGTRSQKIRSKTVGVLVHSSETYPNLTSCSVTVRFQKIIDKPNDEFEVVPNSQFEISRTAFRDNSSYYSINGQRVQFKAVTALLLSHGINLKHNRFLILQGEVEQISLMKPKSDNENDPGLLEFLEDIIGSGRFKEPLEKLSERLDTYNTERTEHLNRVKTLEKEKDDLEGPKNEAVEYIETKNEFTLKENALIQCWIRDHKKEIEERNDTVMKIKEKLEKFKENYKGIDTTLKEKEKELKAVQKEQNVLSKQEEALSTKFSNIEVQDLKIREDLKHNKAKIAELTKNITKEKAKVEDLRKSPVKLEAENKELDTRLLELNVNKAQAEENLQKVMSSLSSETKGLQNEKEIIEAELMKLHKVANDSKSKVVVAQVELDLYISNGQNERTRLNDMQNAYEQCVETIKNRKIEIKSLKAEMPDLEKRIKDDKCRLERVTVEEGEAVKMLREQRTKLEDARNAINSTRSRNELLRRLMEEKNSGRIPGIYGRLGDLGAINEKFDIAISTACGALNHIVTDTIATARECVEFLKRNDIGIASFIALDKMESWKQYIIRPFKAPQNAPRLFDLIKVKDDRFLPAFYFALRNTLVAQNTKEAAKIAFQGGTRHRVVTLEGNLIEISGTMSGGGKPLRGLMGTSVVVQDVCTPQQIEAMEADIARLQETTVTLRQQNAELQEQIGANEKRLIEINHNLRKYEMELQNLLQQEPQLKAEIKEQEKKVRDTEPDPARVAELTAKLDKETAEFNKADETALKVKINVQRIQEQIMEIGGSKMNSAQNLVNDVNKKIDAVIGAMNKNKVTIKTSTRNADKLENKVTAMEAELVECKESLTKGKTDLENLVEVGTSLTKQLHENRETTGVLSIKFNALKEEVRNLNKEKQNFDVEKVTIETEVENAIELLTKAEGKLRNYNKQKANLKLEPVDEKTNLNLPELTEEELQMMDTKALQYAKAILDNKLKDMRPNFAAITDFQRSERRYLDKVAELESVTKQRDILRGHFDNLRKQRLNEFMGGFQIITLKLKETYQMLTLGGDAELELVNSLDPFSDGIVFSVRPPRKSWKNISNLSGGEKTLSSLALVFALHYYKPTPFYVMDEIDAALDFRNVTIVGHYIKKQTKNAQFIVISLRNNMFELADRLVGVYKTHNVSHSVAVDPRID